MLYKDFFVRLPIGKSAMAENIEVHLNNEDAIAFEKVSLTDEERAVFEKCISLGVFQKFAQAGFRLAERVTSAEELV